MRQQILPNKSSLRFFPLIALLLLSANSGVLAQTSTFTYQGRLTDGGAPANGSSSSLRYKTDLAPYRSGLSVVNRLRPISFTWKDGGLRDLGFGAEDVEKIDPLLVTYNQQGQVEGVKYDRINVVLVNALKEQQEQIQAQQRKNEEQQRQIESLKRLVCLSHPRAAVCK